MHSGINLRFCDSRTVTAGLCATKEKLAGAMSRMCDFKTRFLD